MKSAFVAILLPSATIAASLLATTTRYFDGQEGACGCGTSSGNFPWQLGISTGVYTAAGSQALYDTDGASWCGGGCGKCYNLTSTGSAACSTCGTGETAGASIIVMVTNLCPNAGNEQYCPVVGGTNQYGYSYHFDIMAQSEVFGDNPVVEFEPVTCPGQATSDWETCVCFGQTASDETPAGISTDTTSSSSDPSESDSVSTSSSTSTSTKSTSTSISVAAVSSDPPTPTSTTEVTSSSTTLATVASSSTTQSVATDPTDVAPVQPSSTASTDPENSPHNDGFLRWFWSQLIKDIELIESQES